MRNSFRTASRSNATLICPSQNNNILIIFINICCRLCIWSSIRIDIHYCVKFHL